MIRWMNIMGQEIKIRNEEMSDYETVERITREAFYNLYIPGCVEHYLVHIMRNHKDFIPELDFVLELNGSISLTSEIASLLIGAVIFVFVSSGKDAAFLYFPYFYFASSHPEQPLSAYFSHRQFRFLPFSNRGNIG